MKPSVRTSGEKFDTLDGPLYALETFYYVHVSLETVAENLF
jgi:hypothetical protein